MAVLLLALAPASARAATISGTVTDRTVGRPVAGAEVLLGRSESPEPVGRAVTDAKGRYTISGVAPGTYLVVASHQSVPYVRRDVRLEPGQASRTADLEVFQSTTDPSGVSIGGDHILVEPQGNGARAMEILVYENTGKRTYLGEATPASPTGHRLVVPLPEGYTNLNAPDWIRDQMGNRGERSFDLTMPIPPGLTQVAFTYRLPSGFLGVDLARRFPLAVQSASVLVPRDSGWRVRSDELRGRRSATLEGRKFEVATGGPFPPGKDVSVRVASGVLGTRVPRGRLAWGAGGLAIAALTLAWIRRAGQSGRSGASAGAA